MKFYTFCIVIAVVALFCLLCSVANAAAINEKIQGYGGTTSYTGSTITETGTNLAKFGVANATYNQITDSRFLLTLGPTSTNIDHTISAISSNRVSGSIDVKSYTQFGQTKSATLTEGSVVTTGCDASSGALGESQSSQQTSSGLSTSFPTSNYAIIKNDILGSSKDQVQSAKLTTAQVGDNIATSVDAQYNYGTVGSSMYTSTIKSFDKNLTSNYEQDNYRTFRNYGLGDGANNTSHYIIDRSSMNMSNAFDSVSASGNLTTTDIAKAIVANNTITNSS